MLRDRRLGLLALVLCQSCLPIGNSFQTSPRLVGSFRTPAGEPLPLQSLAIARDSNCASPRALTVTDSSGRFSLSATRQHNDFILLLPFDPAAPAYAVCGPVGTFWRPLAHGLSRSKQQTDIVTCVRPKDAPDYFPVCTLVTE